MELESVVRVFFIFFGFLGSLEVVFFRSISFIFNGVGGGFLFFVFFEVWVFRGRGRRGMGEFVLGKFLFFLSRIGYFFSRWVLRLRCCLKFVLYLGYSRGFRRFWYLVLECRFSVFFRRVMKG